MSNRLASWVMGCAALLAASGACAGTNSWSFVGPEGGPAYTLAFHTTNPQIILAATQRGMARSVDRGLSWQVSSTGFQQPPLTIAFDPTSPNRVVASDGRFLLSEDAGVTFQLAQGPNAPNGIRELQFAADGTLYAFLYLHGAYKSVAPFTTWTHLNAPWPAGTSPSVISRVAGNPNVLMVAVDGHGIYRSNDGGTSWTGPPNSGLPPLNGLWFNDLSVDPVNTQNVLTATSQGIFRSTNGGTAWTVTDSAWASSVAFNPANPNFVTALRYGGYLIRSNDGGATWPSTGFQLRVRGAVRTYYPSSDPGRIWFTSDLGIAESPDNGTVYLERNSGLRSFAVHRIVAADDHNVYVALDSAQGVIWRRAAPDYERVPLIPFLNVIQGIRNINALSVAHGQSNTILAVNMGTELIRTVDGGAAWSGPHPAFTLGPSYDYIMDVDLAPSNPAIAYVGRQVTGVWRTGNSGSTYMPLLNSPPYIHALAVDPTDPQVVYASGGPDINSVGIYKTTDGGATWLQKRAPDGTLWFNSFNFHPVDPNTVYASAAGGVLKTTNGGDTWTLVNFGGANGTLASGVAVLFDPLIPTTLVMMGSTGNPGFARSVDGGLTWAETPLTTTAGWGTAIQGAVMLGPGELVAATSSAGVAEYTIAPDLALSLAGLASPLAADSASSGTVTVRNLGPHAVSAAEVRITLPSWLNATVPTNCTQAASVLTCQLPAMNVNQSLSVPLALTVPQAPGSGQIEATVTGHEPDPVGSNNSLAHTVTSTTQARIDLTLETMTPTVGRGDSLTFTARLANPGPSRARDARLELQLGTLSAEEVTALPNACTRTGAVVSCTFGTLEAASSVTVTVRALASAIGTITVSGTATRTGTDAEATDTASLAIQSRPVADFSVETIDAPDPVVTGGVMTYTSTVRNNGPDAGTAVFTLGTLGLTVNTFTITGGICGVSGGTLVICTVDSLANGATASIVVTATAGAVGTGTAVSVVNFDGIDRVAGNHRAEVSTIITAQPAPPRRPGGGGGGRFDWLFTGLLGLLLALRHSRRAT